MRTAALAVSLVFVAACAQGTGRSAPHRPAARTVPADFAGTWNSTVTMTGAAAGRDPARGRENVAAGRDPIPLTVSLVGDSLIAVSAYESVGRVRVTTRTASVRSGIR